MGHVYAEVKIGNVSREKIVERRVLVDTGATYFCLSPQLANELGLGVDPVSGELKPTRDFIIRA